MGQLAAGAQGQYEKVGGLEGLLQDPKFQAGLGILESNYAQGADRNPFTGALRGFKRAGVAKDKQSERDAAKKQRENQDELQKRLQEVFEAQQAPQQHAQQTQTDQLLSGVPQGSPVGGQPDLAALLNNPAAAQTPGINPNAPSPLGGPPGGFTSAPGSTNAAPGAGNAGAPQSQDIGSLLLQYGSPQQQQAAFAQLGTSERFNKQLAQQESQYSRTGQRQRDLAADRITAQQNRPAPYNANIAEYEFFSKLTESQKEEYLDQKRGGNNPSSNTEKVLYAANDAAFKATSNVAKYNRLAENIVQVDPTSGLVSKWTEQLKAVTGQEDATTVLRKEWNSIRVSAATQNLPPGPASDKDIELVLSGFLPETAAPAAVSQFLRGLAKIEDINAQYNTFKAQYISENPARGGVGLNRAWQQHYASQSAQSQAPAIPQTPAASPQDQQLITRWLNPQGAQ